MVEIHYLMLCWHLKSNLCIYVRSKSEEIFIRLGYTCMGYLTMNLLHKTLIANVLVLSNCQLRSIFWWKILYIWISYIIYLIWLLFIRIVCMTCSLLRLVYARIIRNHIAYVFATSYTSCFLLQNWPFGKGHGNIHSICNSSMLNGNPHDICIS